MTDPSVPTRVVAGVEVPAAGVWAIDPEHVYVGFSCRRLELALVRGRFTMVTGAVRIAEDPSESSVEATIAVASVTSGSQDRDDRIRSVEHLDVARHPTAAFRSTDVHWNGQRTRVTGELTLVGVTNTIGLDVSYRGAVVDPWGAQRAMFSAEGVIDREDWGLCWNVTLEGGGLLISRHVRVEIDVEAVRQQSAGGSARGSAT